MLIYPAIDLLSGEAVRLFKGDYAQKTVYSTTPWTIAKDFQEKGATHIHLVDLDGAKNGDTPNLSVICRIKKETGLFCEVGGGIRTMETIEKYVSSGIDRVILGTVAVTNPEFVRKSVEKYGDKIAVGVDLKDGYVATHGWTETSSLTAMDFCRKLQEMNVKTIISTDISKDGAMQGTNRELYRDLSKELSMQIIASGGVSSMDDIVSLRSMNLYGAIVGKAYYTGAIDLKKAIEVAK